LLVLTGNNKLRNVLALAAPLALLAPHAWVDACAPHALYCQVIMIKRHKLFAKIAKPRPVEEQNYLRDLVAYADGSMSTVNAAVMASKKTENGVPLADVLVNIDRLLGRPEPDLDAPLKPSLTP